MDLIFRGLQIEQNVGNCDADVKGVVAIFVAVY